MINALRKIGLTEGEIKVYLALLELGNSTTWNITKKSGISGSKVYEVLERLSKKGLICSIIKNGVKYFEASSPERIINYLDEKKEGIDKEKAFIHKIIPELILKQKNRKKSEVKVFTEFEGIKTANEDIIQTLKKGEEWLSMGLTQQPESWEMHFNKRQEERARKGIIHRHLINEKYKSLYEKRKHLAYTKFRFLSEDFEMPTSIEVYSNKVIILILTKENPLAIMIESSEISQSFKKYFEAIWRIAKK